MEEGGIPIGYAKGPSAVDVNFYYFCCFVEMANIFLLVFLNNVSECAFIDIFTDL